MSGVSLRRFRHLRTCDSRTQHSSRGQVAVRAGFAQHTHETRPMSIRAELRGPQSVIGNVAVRETNRGAAVVRQSANALVSRFQGCSQKRDPTDVDDDVSAPHAQRHRQCVHRADRYSPAKSSKLPTPKLKWLFDFDRAISLRSGLRPAVWVQWNRIRRAELS